MTRSRLIWPDRHLKCPCCGQVADAIERIRHHAKKLKTLECPECNSRFTVAPLGRVCSDETGFQWLEPSGLFVR